MVLSTADSILYSPCSSTTPVSRSATLPLPSKQRHNAKAKIDLRPCAALPASRRSQHFDHAGLKFLLVGDADVGKNEILNAVSELCGGRGCDRSALRDCNLTTCCDDTGVHNGFIARTGTILLDGEAVELQLWSCSGQGRFGTILRSYSRGAQGILVVYDITNRWSFESVQRWLREISEHAPGVPKILIGNRLHLEFNRCVPRNVAQDFAARHAMPYFEISTLASFNIQESLTDLARVALRRSRMGWLFKPSTVDSLTHLCSRAIVARCPTVYEIDRLPLPRPVRLQLRSFACPTSVPPSERSIVTRSTSVTAAHSRSSSDVSMTYSPTSTLTPTKLSRLATRLRRTRSRTLTLAGGSIPSGPTWDLGHGGYNNADDSDIRRSCSVM